MKLMKYGPLSGNPVKSLGTVSSKPAKSGPQGDRAPADRQRAAFDRRVSAAAKLLVWGPLK